MNKVGYEMNDTQSREKEKRKKEKNGLFPKIREKDNCSDWWNRKTNSW